MGELMMTIAIATYRDCRWGDPIQVESIEVPTDRTTPAAAAAWLRFDGRISDRVLDQFSWEGATYGRMGMTAD